MKRIIFTLLIIVLFHGVLFADSAMPVTENLVQIVHPAENARLPALASTFVYGSAPPEGRLLINGQPVPIHPGGGFLAMVKLAPGEFQINAELQLNNHTYRFTRRIHVAEPEKPAPESPLTIEYITPSEDMELLPGDYLEVTCKGSPGKTAYFTITGVKGKFPMTESPTRPGIYHGIYRIENNDKLRKAKIQATLDDHRHRRETKESEGTVSLFPNQRPVMVETISPHTVLYAGPALSQNEKAGYLLFPPQGTVLQITGSRGNEYRVRLTGTKTVWVNKNRVKPLPEGTPPNRSVAGNVTLNKTGNSTLVRIPLGRRIPFEIIPDVEGKYIDIFFYGAFSNTDWITNPVIGAVKQVRWFQDDAETYRLRIDTVPNGWWGYDARYEENRFVLELRTPPPLKVNASPLEGLTIAVDPGHSADTGAVGPTGYAEKDANLAQALVLKQRLIAEGVKVIMTRTGNENVPLNQRPAIAWENRADILISLHNNALPYGGNPFVKRGFGVYYYTPMSLALAKEIHQAYVETFVAGSEFQLRDDGLYYGNLALARAPQMPAVLIESAYMIVPEEEAYLKTDAFRRACADAIITGLKRYAGQMRRK
ncbi:MAG: N-acetylmuramoyl-L-alanine amidase [Firmicutes bacterium]|nr:N-acetylmuramoyl-L-alanine amidase [Bacillota bacterium]